MGRKKSLLARHIVGIAIMCAMAVIGMSVNAEAAYTIMHNFEGSSDGHGPNTLILVGSTLYGTTSGGNTSDPAQGSIYQIATDGTGYKVLYDFAGVPNDGDNPEGVLTLSGSTLYGTTMWGWGVGSIFKIGTDGTGYKVLYIFGNRPSDGVNPSGSLTLIGSTLYGTTSAGGSGYNYVQEAGNGTIFKISTDGTGYTILHNFAGGATDGAHPFGSLTLSGSTLYGMTAGGGSDGYGTIFKISTDGTGYAILHNFTGGASDGALNIVPSGNFIDPSFGVSKGMLTLSGSTLYGVTPAGGAGDCSINGTSGCGTIFQINTDGTGFKILHSFTSASSDGAYPMDSSLALSNNTLYGMTLAGGSGSCSFEGINGCGTVFQINTDGTGFQTLHSFLGGSSDGEYPQGSVILSGSKLYGITGNGGNGNCSYDSVVFGCGTIFSLGVTLPGGLWQNAKDLGSGWKWLAWFGYFNTTSSPWIYHMQLGWLYPFGTSTDSIWFYDSEMGTFWWTSATVYPYVYRAGDGAWLYYDVGTSNPRWFFNYSTNKWEKD